MQSLLDRLTAIPYTGALSDILDELGYPNQVLPHEIQSISPGQTLAGRALTVTGEPAPNLQRDDYFLPFLNMLGAIQPGDVVISQPNDHAVSHFGELSCETAKHRGGRGAVLDGGIRDVDYILKLGFPIFARYSTPRDIVGRWRLNAYNVPITIGLAQINPGDYILGDRDGVIVIPAGAAEEAIAKAEEVVHTENIVRKRILEGMHPAEAYRQYGRF
ncbi:MAG: RraA family protein [Acidobacteriota bacterium]|nr:RraA family protein [Acidobacteriota bacterium]